MAGVRFGVPGRVIEALLPGEPAHLGIGHVVMDVRELFGFRIFRPDSLRAAEIRNAGFGGNAGARQGDDARGGRHPGPHEVDRVRHFVSLYSTWYEQTSCRLIGLLVSILCATSCASSAPPAATRERGLWKPGVRRGLAFVPRRRLSAAAHLGDLSRHPQVQRSARRLLAQGGRSTASRRRGSFRERVAAIDAASLSLEQTARSRAAAARDRLAAADARSRAAVGRRSR